MNPNKQSTHKNQEPGDNQVYLESEKRVSQSVIWDILVDYYTKKGTSAWDDGNVPYGITSNSYTAKYYANIAVMYLKDLHDLGKITADETIYLFELGSGSGHFSYLFLTYIIELLDAAELNHVKFKYIALDIVESNTKLHHNNSYFSKYLESGILDSATFDITKDNIIHLHNSGDSIDLCNNNNKSIFIANYIFDSLPIELLKLENKKILAAYITLTHQQNMCTTVNNLNKSFIYKDINTNDDLLSQNDIEIIKEYLSADKVTDFEYPIAVTHFFDKIKQSPNQEWLIISSDKGYKSDKVVACTNDLSMVFHDKCFSVNVNIAALIKYFNRFIGESHVLESHFGFSTVVYLSGEKINKLPRLSYFIQSNFQPTPRLIFDIANDSLLPFIKSTNFDPDAIADNAFYFLTLLNSGQPISKELKFTLLKAQKNIFISSYSSRTIISAGIIACLLHSHQESINYLVQLHKKDRSYITYNFLLHSYRKMHLYKQYTTTYASYLKYKIIEFCKETKSNLRKPKPKLASTAQWALFIAVVFAIIKSFT